MWRIALSAKHGEEFRSHWNQTSKAEFWAMNNLLFRVADFLSKPPGFYLVLALMAVCTALVPLGWTDVVTYALSVAAIIITGVVLIQGYRDTSAIHAKLDEIVVALNETRNDVVGLEHDDPKQISKTIKRLEGEAAQTTGETQTGA